jgi:hypothetical protein
MFEDVEEDEDEVADRERNLDCRFLLSVVPLKDLLRLDWKSVVTGRLTMRMLARSVNNGRCWSDDDDAGSTRSVSDIFIMGFTRFL